jgi:predicted RNA-binding Zn-ribbon protein involved in translation (DUF1610 family)
MSQIVFPEGTSGSEFGVPRSAPKMSDRESVNGPISKAASKCPACKQVWYSGELICPQCGETLISLSSPIDLLEKYRPTQLVPDQESFQCPDCQNVVLIGTAVCEVCGRLFVITEDTNQIDHMDMALPQSWWPTGQVYVEADHTITFDVMDQRVALPIAECVIVGRGEAASDSPYPHLSLQDFDAHSYGVSRQHLKIVRKDGLIYVSDLGSSNGTFLNGRRLIPHANRLMRSGDELLLGNLKLTIQF